MNIVSALVEQPGSTWSSGPQVSVGPYSPWAAVFVASSLILSQGTGGTLGLRIGNQRPMSSGFAIAIRDERQEEYADLSAMLSDIKLALGLKITELAQILQVERQTIYAWLKSSTKAKPHARNADRLAVIGRIAARWKAIANDRSARSWIVAPGPSGEPSLLDRLGANDIDAPAVTEALERVARALVAATPMDNTRKERLRELRRRGLKPPPAEVRIQSAEVRFEPDDK